LVECIELFKIEVKRKNEASTSLPSVWLALRPRVPHSPTITKRKFRIEAVHEIAFPIFMCLSRSFATAATPHFYWLKSIPLKIVICSPADAIAAAVLATLIATPLSGEVSIRNCGAGDPDVSPP
jgi:hypothetical protein